MTLMPLVNLQENMGFSFHVDAAQSTGKIDIDLNELKS